MGYANGYERLVPLGYCQTIDHVHSVGIKKKSGDEPRIPRSYEKSKI